MTHNASPQSEQIWGGNEAEEKHLDRAVLILHAMRVIDLSLSVSDSLSLSHAPASFLTFHFFLMPDMMKTPDDIKILCTCKRVCSHSFKLVVVG